MSTLLPCHPVERKRSNREKVTECEYVCVCVCVCVNRGMVDCLLITVG